jgi:hypothetical protein
MPVDYNCIATAYNSVLVRVACRNNRQNGGIQRAFLSLEILAGEQFKFLAVKTEYIYLFDFSSGVFTACESPVEPLVLCL